MAACSGDAAEQPEEPTDTAPPAAAASTSPASTVTVTVTIPPLPAASPSLPAGSATPASGVSGTAAPGAADGNRPVATTRRNPTTTRPAVPQTAPSPGAGLDAGVAGTVTSAGQPVPGARVLVKALNGFTSGATQADALGKFQLMLPAGRYSFTVQAPPTCAAVEATLVSGTATPVGIACS
ncbi:MAG: carboxypeptidase-like regulatory domain-containing protein [Actinomycetota bacterium]